MSCVDEFRNYLRNQDFHFEEDVTEENEVFFRLRQSVKNGETLLIVFLFGENKSYLDINIFNIATIDSPLKRDDLLKLINDLNRMYRYPKFVVTDNGEVMAQAAVAIEDGLFSPRSAMLTSMLIIKAIETEYPKFMKLRWA